MQAKPASVFHPLILEEMVMCLANLECLADLKRAMCSGHAINQTALSSAILAPSLCQQRHQKTLLLAPSNIPRDQEGRSRARNLLVWTHSKNTNQNAADMFRRNKSRFSCCLEGFDSLRAVQR